MAISFIEETLNLNEASVHVYKWTNAMIEPRSIVAVSYTHLDVYKRQQQSDGAVQLRTDSDLSVKTVLFGSLALVILMVILPQIPGENLWQKLLLGILVVIFGFFFVTVSSRIVGIIGSSSNPISGMTIATLMATSLV